MMAAKLGIHGQLQQICENVNLQLQFLAIALVDVEVPSSYLSTHSRNTSNNKLASLEATLVRNYDPATHWLTDRGKV